MRPLRFEDGKLILIDQTKLPTELTWMVCDTWEMVEEAIKKMVVRGAPAIGVTAAYGIAIGAKYYESLSKPEFIDRMGTVFDMLGKTRPTAVNLFWAIKRMKNVITSAETLSPRDICNLLLKEAAAIDHEDSETNKIIGKTGSQLVRDGMNILTHCNAGALATSDYGTALGVIRASHESGKKIHVYADETRPWLQGARLTAWELMQSGIPVTLICDNMAGFLMQQGKVDMIITGADRIAANGDTANKIGTYSLAVLARYHNIPFHIAAPISTIDNAIGTGRSIPIEERDPKEVTHIRGIQLAPDGVNVYNPAFDVTPACLISGIITEKGILCPPYEDSIRIALG